MTHGPLNKSHRALLKRQWENMEAAGQTDEGNWDFSKAKRRGSFSPLACSKNCLHISVVGDIGSIWSKLMLDI